MKIFELAKKSNMQKLDPMQQRFFSKMIMNEVAQVAKEKNISEEDAYDAYMHGLYGGDREIGDFER